MIDRIFWEYLEELPAQEAVWYEWKRCLAIWHCFNTFYTHYLKIQNKRAKLLACTTPCEHNCPRLIVENSPSDIMAVCPMEEAAPVKLTFKDTIFYSLRLDAFHRALCVSLKIQRPTGYIWPEFGSTWDLGDYYAASKIYCPVYLTYLAATLPETITSLCQLHHKPFVLMAPSQRGLTSEAQQLLVQNNSFLFSMEAEISMQPDGSFRTRRGISEYMKSCY